MAHAMGQSLSPLRGTAGAAAGTLAGLYARSNTNILRAAQSENHKLFAPTQLGLQNGSPTEIHVTGTSAIKVFSQAAQIVMPGSSEATCPSTIIPLR